MATALEQILRGSTLSPPLGAVKSEPCDNSRDNSDPLDNAGVSTSSSMENIPHRYLQSYHGLSGLSSNLGVVGLSNPSNLANLSNPAGLVSVIMSTSPTSSLQRPQRRSNNPIKCPVCGRYVLFRSEFVKHMRTHTGEKPFGCHLCTYRSAQRSNLNVHLRSIHKVFHPSGVIGGHNTFGPDGTNTTQLHHPPPPFNGKPDTSFI
ncbi:hypothetical protein Pcinc_022605 [Petrolisthes cinctipes]|uniref:C2H2-type domain-containing protein n=1 Tax=Petrolisthes cinctipes TaxID=88211 RepID=A0AAE1KGH4_PETCI|nr:hypothetical protein Pcinc_022605 [Petrolisthes cinctipes]